MLCLVPHDNLHTPIIDAIMTIIINVLKLFLPFYVLVLFIGLSINFEVANGEEIRLVTSGSVNGLPYLYHR